MLTNTVAYGTTKKGNFYEYEKTNKGKKIGALAGAGIMACASKKILSDKQVKEELTKQTNYLFNELKDIKFFANKPAITKFCSKSQIILGIAGAIGIYAGIGKLIGSMFDNHKNKDAKQQAMNEADLQAARRTAQKNTEE